MKAIPLIAVLVLSPCLVAAQATRPAKMLDFPNHSFEQGLSGWKVSEPAASPMTTLVDEGATGTHALRVSDNSDRDGSNTFGPRIPLAGMGKYTLSLTAKPISGSGLGIYIRLYDAQGKRLEDQEAQAAAPSSPAGTWQPMAIRFYTDAQATTAEVWIHSYGAAKVTALLDDFSLSCQPGQARRPWEPQYKLRPDSNLTPADVVGPDGIVYPDFSYAGMPGGIPDNPVSAKLEQYGAAPDDDRDDAAALQRAVDDQSAKGGGTILIGPGIYHLDSPVHISHDNVVIRGSGQERTRLVFRYAIPRRSVRFYGLVEGQTITAADAVVAHAHPQELRSITIFCDGKQIAQANAGVHWGNAFSLLAPTSAVLSGPAGPRVLRAVAQYADGTQASTQITVSGDPKPALRPRLAYNGLGVLTFSGLVPGAQVKLASDGKRGDTQLSVVDASGLKAGDRIRLRAPATPRWNEIIQNACRWGDYRRTDLLITAIDGNKLTVNQPLRIEFPAIDGAYVQKITPIRRCGVEDLTIQQVENLWIHGVLFNEAWECWARGVTIKMAGRNPIYTIQSKWCTIRDCIFDDAHFKGGGGTAYGGFEVTCDSLMENVTTINLRHAPLFQWSASGNVIRNSTFRNSDGQWHSGWTNENLFENCVITSTLGNGGYGYGLWASPPEDEAHGPNGPRNVVYNCDIRSPKTGLWMGGMNENWLIVYNRFHVGSGPAILAKTASFDHIVRGNAVILNDKSAPAIRLATPDCLGVEAIGNTIAGGNGKLVSGPADVAVNQDNKFISATDIPRPAPPVPSIYEWQVARRKANPR